MAKDRCDIEEKLAKKLLRKYSFIKRMWEEREQVFCQAHKKENMIEAKYNAIAKKAGLKSVTFAYNEYCFGVDVDGVDTHGTRLKDNRIIIHDSTLDEK